MNWKRRINTDIRQQRKRRQLQENQLKQILDDQSRQFNPFLDDQEKRRDTIMIYFENLQANESEWKL